MSFWTEVVSCGERRGRDGVCEPDRSRGHLHAGEGTGVGRERRSILQHSHNYIGRDHIGQNSIGQGSIGQSSIGQSSIGQNYKGHNYTGHTHIGHNHIGHDYTGHNYIGHNYIGHNYIFSAYLTRRSHGLLRLCRPIDGPTQSVSVTQSVRRSFAFICGVGFPQGCIGMAYSHGLYSSGLYSYGPI